MIGSSWSIGSVSPQVFKLEHRDLTIDVWASRHLGSLHSNSLKPVVTTKAIPPTAGVIPMTDVVIMGTAVPRALPKTRRECWHLKLYHEDKLTDLLQCTITCLTEFMGAWESTPGSLPR